MKKPLLTICCASFAIAAAGSGATAAEPEIEARYSDSFVECRDDSMATADVIFCLRTESERQEAKLQSAFAAALKRAPARRKAALRAGEANWLKKTQVKCDLAVADEQFDRLAAAKRGQCMLDETIRRTIELEPPRKGR
jgi:uncharacterized protein YecT (DUF1311 family)